MRRKASGNRKHLEAFLPYVIYWLRMSGVEHSYIGMQRLVKSELKLIPAEIYNVYNRRGMDQSEYIGTHGIMSVESLAKFVHCFEVCVGETIEGCLKELAREGGITWSPGEVFIVGAFHHRRVYTTGYKTVLDDVEKKVCDELNLGDELKGRQYLHVVKRDPVLMESFYKECIRRLCEDKKLMAEIRDKYQEKYGDEFVSEMITKYYRLYYIGDIDKDALRKWKLPDKIDDVRLKKAFVNPVGQEMQMLKKKVYEDIFQRMERRKNKLGIPDNDFEKLKLLSINYPKLTNKNYSPTKNKNQGRGNTWLEAREN